MCSSGVSGWRWLAASAILVAFFAVEAAGQEKLAPAPQKSPAATQRSRETDSPLEREEWFYEQRRFPLKEIPAGAWLKAIQRLEEMRAAERAGRAPLPGVMMRASETSWTPIGPQPTNTTSGAWAGRTVGMAVDPTNLDIVYAGGAQGGVWKSTDGGQNWVPLTDSQPTLAIGSIAIDPTSCTPSPCRTIYVGTGEQTFSSVSYYGAGVLKSTDGGATWTQLGQSVFVGPFSSGFAPGGGARIGSLVVNRTNPSVLLAGVQIFTSAAIDGGASSGIYRSADAGVTWTNVLPGAVGTEVFFDPNNPMIAYAALGTTGGDPDNGVYRSTDMGVTWTRVDGTGTNTLPAHRGRIELAIAPSRSSTVYASIADSSASSLSLLGMYRTTDSGANWTQLTSAPDFCNPQCWYDHVIQVHPNDANVVYAGGSAVTHYLTRSIDGGNTWNAVLQGSNGVRPHVDQHVMAFGFVGASAIRLYVGNDGGVWSADVSSSTGPINWTNLNATLNITQFYPGHSIHPSDENIGFGGTQDNGTQKYTGSLPWELVLGADGGWTAIDRAVPSTVYGSCQYICLYRSLQNGARGTYSVIEEGIDQTDRVAFIPPYVIDSNLPQRLYFGTHRVWQTTNSGDLWTAVSPSLTGGTLRAITVAPGSSDVVYVGTSDGRIHRTTNAGAGASASWQEITGTGMLPVRLVTQVAVDANNADVAYATFSGFGTCASCDHKGHVFRTVNGGAAWEDISGTLPDTPVNDLVVDPQAPSTLYIATDVGVFFTTDGGMNWATLVSGLPRIAVFSLKLRQASRTLRAATHGRGLWDLQLPGLPAYHLRSISPTSAAAGSLDLTLTVNGAGFTPSSVVRWNGSNRAPAFVSANQLTVTIPAADLASAAVAQVTVFDPGADTTNALAFAVLGAAPTLSSVSPNTTPQGSGDTVITLTGANFSGASAVQFRGRSLEKVFDSATQLRATIPASELAVGGFYAVAVFNPPPGGGQSGAQTLTVMVPAPPNDNFAGAINAGANPFSDAQNTVGATTETTDPSPTCAASSRYHSIWYRLTPTQNISAVVATGGSVYDTVLSVWSGAPGALVAFACDDDSLGTGGASQLSLALTAGTTYYFMVTGWGASEGGATVFNLTQTAPPANDNFAGARAVSAIAYADSVSTTAATTESSDPAPSCTVGTASLVNNGRAKSVWYRYTASSSGSVTVDTFGSAYDTILTVLTGAPGAFTEVACNDDTTSSTQSQFSFTAAAGTPYFFMVTAFDGSGGATTFHVTAGPAPAPDYAVSASPNAIGVTRGLSGTSTITITPFLGFSSSVALACAGLPDRSACNFAPASVTPGASPVTAMLTISTTAPASSFPVPQAPPRVDGWWWALVLAALAILVWQMRARKIRWAGALALAVLLTLIALHAGCGGGGGGSAPPPSNPGTPLGTYTVTVSATSGTVTRTAVVTLTVN
jgi:hypothetical protein